MHDRSPFHWKYVHTLIGHTANVNSISIDRGSSTLASCSDDKTIRLWDVKTGKHIFTFFGQTKAVFSVAFNPQIPLLASGGLEGTISTWNLEKKIIRSFGSNTASRDSHSDYILSIAFTPNGETLASASADRTIKIWDISRWVLTRTLKGHSDKIWSIAIGSDGQTLASASADKTIRVWNLNGWHEPDIITVNSGWITSVAISPNGKIMASGNQNATIDLWSLNPGLDGRSQVSHLHTAIGHSSAVWSLAFSPDGQVLASGGNDGVKLWNLSTLELCQSIPGHHPVTFSPDGKMLFCGSDRFHIKAWSQSFPSNYATNQPILSGEWWEVLGVDRSASLQEVKLAYRRSIKQYHPDLNSSPNAKEIMQALNQAYAKFEEENS